MLRYLAREAVIVLAAGCLSYLAVPVLLGVGRQAALLYAGLFMSLSFMPMYALSVLAGGRMELRRKVVLGALAWAGAFLPGHQVLAGLPAPVLALWAAAAGRVRGGAMAASGLRVWFSFSFTMLLIRWLVVPLVGANEVMVALALSAGVVYTALRTAVGILWPGSVEGDPKAPPLVYRPVPDHVVGLVEAAARRSARPYFTDADGVRSEEGISILAAPAEAEALCARVRAQLGSAPFVVAPGRSVAHKVEIVVRPRRPSDGT